MLGQTTNQDQLFHEFNLQEYIPGDHLLRGINRFRDLSSSLRQHLAAFYSHTGRPCVDLELTIRMLAKWLMPISGKAGLMAT